ncbi:MAG: type II secretion system inner membrane protein GspF [Myxococcales bacterium]|nr:type II secretion system inner membrane protein GspF [Myxococcales bacterium]
MAVFEYRGIVAASGKSVNGVRDAENQKALRTTLRRDGILLTQAKEGKTDAERKKERGVDLKRLFDRPKAQDIAVMTRQLATLVRAKIPLFEALTALIDQVERASLRRMLTEVRDQVREGKSFATALELHPKVFTPLYTNMVRAGEASGTLEQVLDRLTGFIEGQARLKGKVTSALAYPALMLIIAVGLISVLMVAVVPKLTQVFASQKKNLPWYTELLIGTSRFMASFWWLLAIVIGVGVWAFRRWLGTKLGRLAWDSFALRAPVFGKLTQMVAIARFTRTLGTLLGAGVPLLQAMDIVRTVLGNVALEKVVSEASGSIREGQSIAEPLKRSGRFPPLVTHMIAIGERSGQLEEMLENVAVAYDHQVETRVGMLTSLLEPLIIVVMGAAVGFIAMAILFPLVQASDFK